MMRSWPTAGIYFREGKYEDADYHYTLLRREYPRSEFQFEAHLLGLQSKLRKYQGDDYDGTPLEEAQQLVKQLRTNFAGQLSAEERDRLKTVSAQLTEELAARDMKMAQVLRRHQTLRLGQDILRRSDQEISRLRTGQEARDRDRARSPPAAGSPAQAAGVGRRTVPEEPGACSLAKVPEIKNGTLIAQRQSPATTTPSGQR